MWELWFNFAYTKWKDDLVPPSWVIYNFILFHLKRYHYGDIPPNYSRTSSLHYELMSICICISHLVLNCLADLWYVKHIVHLNYISVFCEICFPRNYIFFCVFVLVMWERYWGKKSIVFSKYVSQYAVEPGIVSGIGVGYKIHERLS